VRASALFLTSAGSRQVASSLDGHAPGQFRNNAAESSSMRQTRWSSHPANLRLNRYYRLILVLILRRSVRHGGALGSGRNLSEIRTGCANQRPSGSVRQASGNWCPYRDRQLSSVESSPASRRMVPQGRTGLKLSGRGFLSPPVHETRSPDRLTYSLHAIACFCRLHVFGLMIVFLRGLILQPPPNYLDNLLL
jgi:hypothetical protein